MNGEENINHMLDRVNCNLCNGFKSSVLYSFGEFNVVKCRNCGLIYINPRLAWTDLKQMYSHDYFMNKSYNRGYEDYLKDEKNNIATFKKRLDGIKKYKKQGKILDIGCATGILLMLAQKEKWDVYGVEISEFAIEYAKKRFNLNLFKGTLKEARYLNNFFDVVVMDNVIEHLPDPLSGLEEINRILKDNGLLYVVTPNIKSSFAHVVGKRWLLLKPDEHLYYFSPKTIKKMLENKGFKLIKIESIGKVCSLDFLVSRLRNYNTFLSRQADFVVKYLEIGQLSFYVNLGDVMVAYAKKL